MATLALITLPLSGHIHPMVEGAHALRKAGHRPVFVGPPDVLAKLPDDVETHPIGETDLPRGQLDAACACLSAMRGLGDMRRMLHLIARLSRFYIDHLPGAVEALGASAIIHDQLEPGAGIVARGLSRSLGPGRTGLAHISLACALPMNREPSVPPPFRGWRYRPSAYGRWLNGGYYNVVNRMLAEQGRVLQAGARRFGLSKPVRNPDGTPLQDWQKAWSVDDGLSPRCDIAQGLANLDFPRARPPAYLGPFRPDRSLYPGLEAIAAERDGRPLAFLSLGTLMGGRARLFRAMADAAITAGLQPVIVHGGRLADTAELPSGAIVRDFLDQRAVMAESAAAIIHGGYNSTTDAVAAGLPLVTLPIAFEQAAIAARIDRAGLGRIVNRMGPSLSQRIGFALGAVMERDSYRMAMRRAQYEALAAPGASGLVGVVDGALSGAPPLSARTWSTPQTARPSVILPAE